MNVIDTLINTLATLKYPVYLQGTFSGDQYPPVFFTYIVNASDDRAHYNDNTTSWTWQFTVIFYTNDPTLLDTVPEAARAALKAAGFIPQGKGLNVYSDDPNFTGWSLDYLFLDK